MSESGTATNVIAIRERAEPERSAGVIPEIESLRGIAIALVFMLHADNWVNWRRVGIPGSVVSPLYAFVRGGHTGVSLFFILSGFLLSRPFLTEATGGKRVDRWNYYARRALRILPLYYAAVVAASVLSASSVSDVLRGIPFLFFLNGAGWSIVPLWPYSGVWWSLATEVQFYVLLPLLPFFLRTRGRRWVGCSLLLAYAIAYVAFAYGTLHLGAGPDAPNLSHSVFGRGPLFALGILAAWFYMRHGSRVQKWCERTNWVRAGACDVLLLAVLVGLGYLLREVVLMSYMRAERLWPAWHVIEGMLWTSVLLLVLLAPLRTRRLLSNGILETLGILSYSIYLIHYQLVVYSIRGARLLWPDTFLIWNLPTLGLVGLIGAACVALSAVSYRAIERPFLQRKARIGRSSRGEQGAGRLDLEPGSAAQLARQEESSGGRAQASGS